MHPERRIKPRNRPTRYDPETVRRITALAARLQTEQQDWLTAAQIEEIGAEIGIESEYVRQAVAAYERGDLDPEEPRQPWGRRRAVLVPVCFTLSMLVFATSVVAPTSLYVSTGCEPHSEEPPPYVAIPGEPPATWFASGGQPGGRRLRPAPLAGDLSRGFVQTFPTRPGGVYRVRFDLASGADAQHGTAAMLGGSVLHVRAAGQSVLIPLDGGRRAGGWASVAWEFTATGPETTLEIRAHADSPGGAGPVDRVSVVSVH